MLRKLGIADLYLTTIGLGTWAMGGGNWKLGWGPQDEKESIDTIHRAIDLGINWLDTAPAYGIGVSEEVVGKALAGKRNKMIIATKCGRIWKPDNSGVEGRLKAEFITKEAEDSLRRLKTDVIDLYQIHWPIPDEDIEEGWTAIAKLVKQGKVRYAGVSNFSITQMQRIQPVLPIASLQPPYSMIKREVEYEVLSFCANNRIGVIPYSPLQSGVLTERFSLERIQQLDEKDWRAKGEEFQGNNLKSNLALVEGLKKIAAEHHQTVSHLAIAWVLRRPEVTSVIVGARTTKQIEENVGGGEWVLTPEIINRVEGLLQARKNSLA